jgi:hypothetical protein
MPEVRKPAEVFLMEYECDICGGKMQAIGPGKKTGLRGPEGQPLETAPGITHECKECHATRTLDTVFPRFEVRPAETPAEMPPDNVIPFPGRKAEGDVV